MPRACATTKQEETTGRAAAGAAHERVAQATNGVEGPDREKEAAEPAGVRNMASRRGGSS